MQELRANTQVIVTVGPFVDVGDGFTPQTDITLGGNEAELIKHGSTAVVDISGATWAAVTDCRGYYSLTLTTSHTDTEGLLVVIVQDDSDCLPVKQEYMVLSQAAWDSKYVAKDSGFMDVNVKTIGRADAQETEADNLETACANYSATRGLTGTALPAAAADAAGGLPVSDDGGLDLDGEFSNLASTLSAIAGYVDELEERLTAARAGYLDNLNVGGNVASSAEVTSIQNNTRCVRVVPSVIERPDSGTATYRIELLLYDAVGNMEAPDSAPTIALVDQDGNDLSARLDAATMSLVSAGRYRAVYTATSTDDLEQLVWTFSVVEGGATRSYGNTSLIVDTTAVDFTAADRTKLEAVHGKLPSKDYLAGTDNADGDVQIDEATGTWPGQTLTAAYDAAKTAAQAGDAMTLEDAAITAAKFAADAIAAAAVAAAAANKLADHVRRRTQANVEASSDGDALAMGSQYGAIQQMQEANTADNPGELTVYKTDGTTELGRLTLATDAAADPVTGVS